MTARERAKNAIRVAAGQIYAPHALPDVIEEMFRAHASEAIALARQEWEDEQDESGFRHYVNDTSKETT